jgi:MFS family permease
MFFNASEYRSTFAFLFIPFIMLLMVLVYTYKRISQKIAGAMPPRTEKKGRLARPFYIYTFAVLLNTVGLIPYTLILYKASQILPTQQWIVPLIYLLIQGVDAPAALLSGYAFDKVGTKILVLPFLLSVFPPLFATFNTSLGMLLVAAAIYGIVLGMQESVYRAAVSEFSPVSSRGTAYGIFNTAYGIGFLISGAIYGLLIDLAISFSVVLFYALVAQTVATTLLLKLRPTPKEEK